MVRNISGGREREGHDWLKLFAWDRGNGKGDMYTEINVL